MTNLSDTVIHSERAGATFLVNIDRAEAHAKAQLAELGGISIAQALVTSRSGARNWECAVDYVTAIRAIMQLTLAGIERGDEVILRRTIKMTIWDLYDGKLRRCTFWTNQNGIEYPHHE